MPSCPVYSAGEAEGLRTNKEGPELVEEVFVICSICLCMELNHE